ncbi:MAG: lamin tail domain-containing protein [Candidatus Poribacteria bacterium]|nr:lamin tail domain-containing protein [Candidatus Poribacteria bacterium]
MQFRLTIVLILLCGISPSAFGAIVINEVMANPLDEDTGEFIELFNTGPGPIDVLDWQFTDGDATDIIQPFRDSQTAIPPKGYALILDAEYADDYDLPPDTVLLTTKNTTLGNGLQINDPITLFDDSGTKVIDTYAHPFNPKNGISAERVDVTVGDIPENWKASIDPSGSTPGRENSVVGAAIDKPPDEKPELPDDESKPPDDKLEPEPEKPSQPEPEEPLPPITALRINEIMHSPDTKAGQTEWLELFNPTPQPVNLDKWRVEDASGRSGIIPENIQILAGGFLIVTKNESDFRSQYPDAIEVVEIKLPALNNSGDTIILYDFANREIDTVSYTGSGSIRGRSLERVQPDLPSDQQTNWQLSVALAGATPGETNSRSQKIQGKPKLTITPTPFNPKVSETTIRYEASTDASITVQIFDSAGRLVRILLDRREAGGNQAVNWDGRDEDGERVPVGIYICQLIISGNRKQPATRVAKTIVVAEKL